MTQKRSPVQSGFSVMISLYGVPVGG